MSSRPTKTPNLRHVETPVPRQTLKDFKRAVDHEASELTRRISNHAYIVSKLTSDAYNSLRDSNSHLNIASGTTMTECIDVTQRSLSDVTKSFNDASERVLNEGTTNLRKLITEAKDNDEIVYAAGLAMLDSILNMREHTLFRFVVNNRKAIDRAHRQFDSTCESIREVEAGLRRTGLPLVQVMGDQPAPVSLRGKPRRQGIEADLHDLHITCEEERRAQVAAARQQIRQALSRTDLAQANAEADLKNQAAILARKTQEVATHAATIFRSLVHQAEDSPTTRCPLTFDGLLRTTSVLDSDMIEVLGELAARFEAAGRELASSATDTTTHAKHVVEGCRARLTGTARDLGAIKKTAVQGVVDRTMQEASAHGLVPAVEQA
ncbi:hypothetical protein J8273_0188 [Carpediemonas membranifera]|uniref:Uncharacterized protein n=1 Tax=Carpediemonas membranifera TaxID=201153 RepID=A0A8J6AZ59_9EUKA|nr:hypothetical protein J8273_0188 [Carpediemonas membranifera]|eukprot:KAG9394980.1 hypothetical protein J8273_0188 [Carpediemonas membranifera]